MSLIHWDDSIHSVGIAKMDEQHKQLVGLINALNAQKLSTDQEFLDRVITTLITYTKHHFVDEEKILKKLHFPHFESHHAQHKNFIHYVTVLKADFDKKGPSKELLEGLSRFLAEWIVRHILVEDKAYRTFLES